MVMTNDSMTRKESAHSQDVGTNGIHLASELSGTVTSHVRPAEPCTFVIFGASGDLTRRLLIPSLYNLAQEDLLPERFATIGVARSGTADELLDKFKAS